MCLEVMKNKVKLPGFIQFFGVCNFLSALELHLCPGLHGSIA